MRTFEIVKIQDGAESVMAEVTFSNLKSNFQSVFGYCDANLLSGTKFGLELVETTKGYRDVRWSYHNYVASGSLANKNGKLDYRTTNIIPLLLDKQH
jgi:hypothetical protein